MNVTTCPSQPMPPVVFRHTVEGLFQVALRGKVTPEMERRLRLAGLDLSRPLAPAYSYGEWVHFLRIAAETLWPGEVPYRAYHALGCQMMRGYANTFIGKAVMTLLRLLGPRRALERMADLFRSGCNYNLLRFTDVAPREVLLWINEPDFSPGWVAGLFESAVRMAGARSVQVDVDGLDAEGCTYRIRWEE